MDLPTLELPALFRDRSPACERYLAAVDRTLERDLFMIDATCYPLVEPEAAPDPSVSTYLQRVQEDPDARARREKEALARAVQDRARGLRLRSTMIADRPVAVINDQMVTVGGAIDGFRVTGIEQGSCTVEQDGVEVNLLIE